MAGTEKSFAKIVLVDIHHKHSHHPQISVYAILDEKSNKFLAKPKLFEILIKTQFVNHTKCLPAVDPPELLAGDPTDLSVAHWMYRQLSIYLH